MRAKVHGVGISHAAPNGAATVYPPCRRFSRSNHFSRSSY